MEIVSFNSNIKCGRAFFPADRFSELDIKNEPMLFNCDLNHAEYLGGHITKRFIDALPEDWLDGPLIIDSRAHMLMEGWYPCIPGWHHDDVQRTRADKQPNYFDNSIRSEHVMMLVNGVICPTQFGLGDFELGIHDEGTIYKYWDDLLVENDDLFEKVSCPDRTLVFFNDRSFHRGTPAVKDGWRFFIRASRHFNAQGERIARGDGWKNERRTQVQVYIDPINKGW